MKNLADHRRKRYMQAVLALHVVQECKMTMQAEVMQNNLNNQQKITNVL